MTRDLALGLAVLLVVGCAAQAPTPSPSPTPIPTPMPTPTPVPAAIDMERVQARAVATVKARWTATATALKELPPTLVPTSMPTPDRAATQTAIDRARVRELQAIATVAARWTATATALKELRSPTPTPDPFLGTSSCIVMNQHIYAVAAGAMTLWELGRAAQEFADLDEIPLGLRLILRNVSTAIVRGDDAAAKWALEAFVDKCQEYRP